MVELTNCINMKQEGAKRLINEKWNEIVRVFHQGFNPNEYRLEVIDSGSHDPKIIVRPRRTKTKSNRFVVTWKEKNLVLDSGKRNGASVLAMIVELAGVDSVQKLNISARGGNNLVCDSVVGIEKHLPKEVDGKFIITKSENKDKYNQILEIIQKLHLDAEIKWG